MKVQKTNAMRQFDRHKMKYEVMTYDASDGFTDGISVAKKCNCDITYMYKTIVTRSHSKKIYVFVVNAQDELDLKKCARSVNEKSIEMIHVKELLGLTGYVRGGCSPIGMKKDYPVIVSDTISALDTIVFSGGKIGLQIKCSTLDFLKITQAQISNIIKENL